MAILALAIGIGANTAIFSVANALALKSLPFRDPGKLVLLWGNVRRVKVERRGASYPDFVDWRKQSTSFEELAIYNSVGSTLVGADENLRIKCEQVSASYFPLLGISPLLGRTFLPSEDEVPMRDMVAILSEGLWKRRFGSDPAIIGKTIRTITRPYTVVGVVHASFPGISDEVEMWVPFMTSGSASDLAERGSRGAAVLGRLKPGVTIAQAQAELTTICRRLEQLYPASNEGRSVEVAALDQEMFGDIRPAVWALLGAVAFVLLIACANVANLLLARSEARQREIALRAALGASRLRLWRQLMTESCVLSALGALVGLLLAVFGVRALVAVSPIDLPSFVHPTLDVPMALFTVAISLACGIAMGFAPAFHARIAHLHDSLKESSGRVSGGRLPQRFRNALVVAEMSLTLVLLVGAGLLIRSLDALIGINPGFDSSHVLCLTAGLPRTPAAGPDQPALSADRIIERIQALPSVQAVAAGTDLPLSHIENATFYTGENQPPVTAQNMPRAYIHGITPGFFRALKAKLVAGQSFSADEMNNKRGVVIVSENVAKRFWPGENPIDKHIKLGRPNSQAPWLRVVGVAGEMKYRGLPNNPTADPDIYLPLPERERDILLVVRTRLDPAATSSAVRSAIHDIDKSITIFDVATMSERIGEQTARSRFVSWLMGVFAAIAVLLAMVGVYGVMSYLVTRRTQEIGLRIALGAERGDVLGLIVRQGMPLILMGIALGLVASFGLTRLLATLLYGVTATDALTFAVVPLLLLAIALLACWLPALRASRVDPVQALRFE